MQKSNANKAPVLLTKWESGWRYSGITVKKITGLKCFPASRLSGCLFFISVIFILSACADKKEENTLPALPSGVEYPGGIIAPDAAKVKLGRHLFFDRRLSFNQTKSCAGCHAPQFAFTDGYRRSFGATADLHLRNSEPLFNLAFLQRFTAANPTFTTLEQQMGNPLYNTKFIELGVTGHETEILNRLQNSSLYRELFAKAFPGQHKALTMNQVIASITAFMKTIISANSPYDRYTYYGEKNALDASAQHGLQLFFSDSLGCSGCHSGFNFSGGINNATLPLAQTLYFNNGLYNTDGKGACPPEDEGLKTVTRSPEDMGKFRVPTLRNLLFTGPYMHDGSMATLSEIIDMYARGGRLIEQGSNSGDGSKSPMKHPRIKGFRITPQQKADLLGFLVSLSDSSFISNPKYQNPFGGDETKAKY